MKNSQAPSLAISFRKSYVAHPPASNDNDHPGGATPIALTASEVDDRVIAFVEQAYRPWLVPGVVATL
jgi:hypothetical protein